MPEKKPADRQTKAKGYTFLYKGKRHSLPDFSDQQDKIPGGVVMDALANPDPELAELQMAIAAINAPGVPPKAREALREMPFKEMFQTVGEWMGETGGSSD